MVRLEYKVPVESVAVKRYFNSLMVRLESYSLDMNNTQSGLFQFLNGAIGVNTEFTVDSFLGYFNSLMVRLECLGTTKEPYLTYISIP